MNWDELFKRRETLIEKHYHEGLTTAEADELEKLQNIGGLIRDYFTPPLPPELQQSVDAQFDWGRFNPDAATLDEIGDWARFIQRSDIEQLAIDWTKNCADGTSAGELQRAVIHVWLYLITKARAMRCRLKGEIEYAIRHEEVCQMIYNRLPEEIKW